jgi:ubiquinone/menaquinone biosynthesis C-methylase UbiE
MSGFKSDYYKKHYPKVHYKGLLGIFTNGYHKKIEKIYNSENTYEQVLEIGGGSGEHVRYIEHEFINYTIIDIVENIEKLSALKSDPRFTKIKFVLADAASLPFEAETFDRVFSTCVLHHITDLESVIREIRRVTKKGGTVDLYVPCDPGMIYRWIRHWTSHYKQKKSMNVDWGQVKFLWAMEHRNHYLSILFVCKEIFKEDNLILERYPLKYSSWNFNLYSIIRIKLFSHDSF